MRISGLAAVALAAALAAATATAQQNPFVGTWRAVTQWGTITTVMGPDMRYSEQMVGGSIMTLQQGYYVISGDLISFTVVDWAPKTMPVYHPVGTTGGYWTQQPTTKPPGGTFRFHFTSPDSVTMQDVNFHGVATFTRIQ